CYAEPIGKPFDKPTPQVEFAAATNLWSVHFTGSGYHQLIGHRGIPMSFARVEAFLSCSFRSDDEEVVRLFVDLCSALNITCSNVNAGSFFSPSEVARKKLEDQDFLIAICTRRDEKKTGKFAMPDAVRDEIGIAFGKERPILLFVEDGVEIGGFEPQFGTHV